jgi:hypothetical protein
LEKKSSALGATAFYKTGRSREVWNKDLIMRASTLSLGRIEEKALGF